MAKKVDGVIEAVRYKNGEIEVVRAFERRGATFSDWIMIPRRDLLERLKDGRNFMTGTRKELLASTFETGKPVRVVSRDGKEFISTRENADRDELDQVPVF
jgi:hypothetical protein